MENTAAQPQKPKRNNFISYLKGYAIIAIMIIHLMDWSGKIWTKNQILAKELTYPGVMFFVALAGTVIYVAYNKKDLKDIAKRLTMRFFEILGIFYAYNIIKALLVNFKILDISKEPLFMYQGFVVDGKFNIMDILALKSNSVPIAILLLIATLLLISPIFMYFAKKQNKLKHMNLAFIFFFIFIFFVLKPEFQPNLIGELFFGKGKVLFPVYSWIIPYLIGLYLAQIGFDKHKGKLLAFFGVLTAIFYYYNISKGMSWYPSYNMYPMQLFYISSSFFFMYLLIYIFALMEKFLGKYITKPLEVLKILGDRSMDVYLVHWIVIDLTIFFWKQEYIIYTVPVAIAGLVILDYLTKYLKQKEKVS